MQQSEEKIERKKLKAEPNTDRQSMREIERERQSSRAKIDSITKTVDFPNNLDAMYEMEKILGPGWCQYAVQYRR